ncbi:hypothetical protein LINGRAHAP2_LOCUS8490 [Linum grandiflorum]
MKIISEIVNTSEPELESLDSNYVSLLSGSSALKENNFISANGFFDFWFIKVNRDSSRFQSADLNPLLTNILQIQSHKGRKNKDPVFLKFQLKPT